MHEKLWLEALCNEWEVRGLILDWALFARSGE
jgi:hypothetical protein